MVKITQYNVVSTNEDYSSFVFSFLSFFFLFNSMPILKPILHLSWRSVVSLLNSSVITICNLLILYCQHCKIILSVTSSLRKCKTLKELNSPHWSQKSCLRYLSIVHVRHGLHVASTQSLKETSSSFLDYTVKELCDHTIKIKTLDYTRPSLSCAPHHNA